MKVYIKKEHEIYLWTDKNKQKKNEKSYIMVFVKFFPLFEEIILVRHLWGPRSINRRYEQIYIPSILEPRDDTPAKDKDSKNVCNFRNHEEGLQE